jgi:hypothetical protein
MASRFRKLSMAILGGGMVAGSPLIAACSSIPFIGASDEKRFEEWKATDGATGRINLQAVEEAFKASWDFGNAKDFKTRVNEIYEGDGLVVFRSYYTAEEGGIRQFRLEGYEDLDFDGRLGNSTDEGLFLIDEEKGEYVLKGNLANGYYTSRFGLGEPDEDRSVVVRAYIVNATPSVKVEYWKDQNGDDIIVEGQDSLNSSFTKPLSEPLPPEFIGAVKNYIAEDSVFTLWVMSGSPRAGDLYRTPPNLCGESYIERTLFRNSDRYAEQLEVNRVFAEAQESIFGDRYREAGVNIGAARQTYLEAVKATGSFDESSVFARARKVTCHLYQTNCPKSELESEGDFSGGGGQVRFRSKRRGQRARQYRKKTAKPSAQDGCGSVNAP